MTTAIRAGQAPAALEDKEMLISGSEAEILKDVEMAKQKVQNLKRDIKDMIGITVKVSLVPPGTIPRSEGKAKRVDDRRPKVR